MTEKITLSSESKVLRKGQHLFNEISRTHKLKDDYSNLHQILFYMTDKEFDEIMERIV